MYAIANIHTVYGEIGVVGSTQLTRPITKMMIDAIAVLSFGALVRKPDEEDRRLAMNNPLLLAQRTNAGVRIAPAS